MRLKKMMRCAMKQILFYSSQSSYDSYVKWLNQTGHYFHVMTNMAAKTISQPNRAASQAAIAARAGVARTTVSLALRGGEGLNAETLKRILDAAEELGYRPNNLVQALRSGRTGLVGVMVPPCDTFWSNVLYGIHDVLIAQNHVPMALWSHRHEQVDRDRFQLDQLHRLFDWRADGAIMWPSFCKIYRKNVSALGRNALPLVAIDCLFPAGDRVTSIMSDEADGGRQVADYLRGLGHRHLLHLAGPSDEDWACDRRDAIAAAWSADAGETLDVLTLSYEIERVSLIRERLARSPQITAVFAATDEFAEETYLAAQQLGWRVPDDLSVVGYGDNDFSSRMFPALTTVRHEPYRMGEAAAAALVEKIQQQPDERAHAVKRFAVELVTRGSTSAPRVLT